MTQDEKLDRILAIVEFLAGDKLPQQLWSDERARAESENQKIRALHANSLMWDR